MANKRIEVKDLTLVFGKNKKLGLKLLDEGKSIKEIREEEGIAIGVNDISFDIEEGEMFVIVGLSGSGKSSLIRCMNMLNVPTRGQVLVDGENICDYTKDELLEFRRHKVAMVFQHFGLLSHRTVLKNVEYGLEIQKVEQTQRRKKALEAIKLVSLDGWEDYYPRQLSGGMKQRVGLARALTNEPEILLMDEPFSALDPLIRRDMQTELLSIEDYVDKTIVFITHDMNEAFRLGDRVALLKDGELIQIGKPRDFFENPANKYVESFIEDVDKSRILRVKTVMTEPKVVGTKGQKRTELIQKLQDNEEEHCYVVDENNRLVGYVELEKLLVSTHETIDKTIDRNYEEINRNAFLADIWSKLDESEVDVAVTDKRNYFRGVIGHEDVVSALS
jgi:glycine betaine/proline transport system ATP-binding protein